MEQSLGAVVTSVHADSMDTAVSLAAQHAVAGDTVLLSPACASFDMFTGYVARGLAFSASVAGLQEGES